MYTARGGLVALAFMETGTPKLDLDGRNISRENVAVVGGSERNMAFGLQETFVGWRGSDCQALRESVVTQVGLDRGEPREEESVVPFQL